MKRREFAIGERVIILIRDLEEYQPIEYDNTIALGEITNKYDLPDDAIYDVFVAETDDGDGTIHGATFRRYECNIFRTYEEAVKGKVRQINELIKKRRKEIKFLKMIKEDLINEPF